MVRQKKSIFKLTIIKTVISEVLIFIKKIS